MCVVVLVNMMTHGANRQGEDIQMYCLLEKEVAARILDHFVVAINFSSYTWYLYKLCIIFQFMFTDINYQEVH